MQNRAIKSVDLCIKDRTGRILAWCAGMSKKDINRFLDKYKKDGAHLSEHTVYFS